METSSKTKTSSSSSPSLLSRIFDSECILSNVCLLTAIVLCIYFAFIMPSDSVTIAESDDKTCKVVTEVTGYTRFTLCVWTIIGAVLQYKFMKYYCSNYSMFWTVGAALLSVMILILIYPSIGLLLSSTRNVQTNSDLYSPIVNYLSRK